MWPFTRPGIRVMAVCSANVCRSPAAAVLLGFHLRRLGARHRVAISSAGTAVAAPGAPADPRMVSIAAECGIRLRGHRAAAVNEEELNSSSRIWVMETRHSEQLISTWPTVEPRVDLLHPDGRDISDPYFGDKAGVRATFELLDKLCRLRAEELIEDFL